MRRRWRTVAGAMALGAAIALGGFVAPIAQAGPPPPDVKDFSKPAIVTGGNPQSGRTEAEQMRKMLLLLGFPDNRIIVEDRANSTVQNAQLSVPLAKQAGTSGIILVTSTTLQGRADGDFADAGGNLLSTVSYPDGDPGVNVVQFARDAISPFVGVGG
ncbi:MAG: hypothetical protein QOI01_302 [Mycobacterium sp.]|jgi:uncharacterized SAM-binding protein YcdF (DUF218 family)|nr:hypothetical protein [Mycobacterium sp.]